MVYPQSYRLDMILRYLQASSCNFLKKFFYDLFFAFIANDFPLATLPIVVSHYAI